MHIYQLNNIHNREQFLKNLNVHGGGVSIMAKKMELLYFYIKDLNTPAVNILKQDALSIGAELATPSGVILCEREQYEALLVGTRKHIEILSKKELAQPFGLKRLAEELQAFLKAERYPTKIMGIINANDDSFFSGSRFLDEDAVEKKEKMIADGADIIDIGAVSSRPGAEVVSGVEELARIGPICDAIKHKKLYEKVSFSVDSYTPKVIEYALKRGFNLVNDITGAADDEVVKLAVEYGAKLSIMHIQGTPQTMQINPHYDDVMVEISEFFEERIAKCEALGMRREDIVLDVGIGFGKTLEHNLILLRNMGHFKKFGCEVLVGVSRKSMIDKILPTPIEERLAGTLTLHIKAVEHGASIVRCHDVKEHHQALKILEALNQL
jgi:dihydropteroate synthase